MDERVALDFVNWPRHYEKEYEKRIHAAWLLYGLVCMDVKGQELLLPNPDGMDDVPAHDARLWVHKDAVADASQMTGVDAGSDTSGVLRYFSIATYTLRITAIGAGDNEVYDNAPKLDWRDSKQQPWRDRKWVRSIEKQTGRSMISDAQRDDPALVRSRVKFRDGRVTAVPPFSPQGQHAEWRSVLTNRKVVTAATTDAMLWTRRYPDEANRLRVTFVNSSGSRTLDLKLDPRSVAIITHATSKAHSNPKEMRDSTAFARLLAGNDPSSFPVPVLDTSFNTSFGASSDDVHCEGGRP